MQYRKMGKTGLDASILGFGAMRLPVKDGAIDEQQAREMLDYAIAYGINYVDTAYPYHGGESEKWLGKMLKAGYRDKFKLATKLPAWLIKQPTDFDKYFREQLDRLQSDHIDFYLMHGLATQGWDGLKDLGVIEWIAGKQKSGAVGNVGFSFHGAYEDFAYVAQDYDWSFCQIQYNYIDIQNQAGEKGLKLAHRLGLPVIVMEPLLGGRLVAPPASVQRIWDTAANKRNAAEWALQWLWHQPEVTVVLSGMSNLQQLKDNIGYAERAGSNSLTAEELALFPRVRKAYQDLTVIPCTGCGYCMPCSQGVNIPRMFKTYNDGYLYDKQDAARGEYDWIEQAFKLGISQTDERALQCIQCRECEEKCPQKIPIADWMEVMHKVLGEGKDYVTKL
jgi:predicted aldo/keto reductase-like oxidoreductase